MMEKRQKSEWILGYQRSLMSKCVYTKDVSLFFVIVVDVVKDLAIDGVLSKLLCADDLILICETIEGLWNKSYNGRRHSRVMVGK